MRTLGIRRTILRGVRRASVPVLVLSMALVVPSYASAPVPSSVPENEVRQPFGTRQTGTADGQITAHDGKFWLGSQPIVLRGINFNADPEPEPEHLAQIASWGMNFIRIDTHWDQLELVPPTYVAGRWVHVYDPIYLQHIKNTVNMAYDHGLYVMIESSSCSACSYFGWPWWQFTSPYNSHGVTYQQTEEGKLQAQTDFWSDDLRQEFMIDELEYLATQLRGLPGIIGYEPLNEPKAGNLPIEHATTQLIVDWQLTAADAIRDIDAPRVIFFLTRAGFAPGISEVDLTGWVALGNVAFDLHDYFGGRWGDGHGGENEGDPTYHELIQNLFNHVLNEEEETGLQYDYGGTTQSQVQFIGAVKTVLEEWGIPLVVAEFGDFTYDPGVYQYFGTITSALNHLGVSWAATAYIGPLGIVNTDGTLRPWAQIVIDAAGAP